MQFICWHRALNRRRKFTFLFIFFFGFFVVSNFQKSSFSDDNLHLAERQARLKGALRQDDPYVIRILRDEFLNAPSTLPYNISSNSTYGNGASYGFNESLQVIQKLFKDKPYGLFVEAGALDGLFLSNTLWLERAMNWTGLLIEPNPQSYKELLSRNRKAWTSNTCLSAQGYPKHATFVIPDVPSPYFRNNVIGSSYEYGLAYNDEGMEKFLQKFRNTYYHSVCFPLYSYLLALNVSVINFLSLDIQGAELDVLNTLPLDKIMVEVLVIEDMHKRNSSEHQSFLRGVRSKNFTEFYILNYDTFFLNNKFVVQ